MPICLNCARRYRSTARPDRGLRCPQAAHVHRRRGRPPQSAPSTSRKAVSVTPHRRSRSCARVRGFAGDFRWIQHRWTGHDRPARLCPHGTPRRPGPRLYHARTRWPGPRPGLRWHPAESSSALRCSPQVRRSWARSIDASPRRKDVWGHRLHWTSRVSVNLPAHSMATRPMSVVAATVTVSRGIAPFVHPFPNENSVYRVLTARRCRRTRKVHVSASAGFHLLLSSSETSCHPRRGPPPGERLTRWPSRHRPAARGPGWRDRSTPRCARQ